MTRKVTKSRGPGRPPVDESKRHEVLSVSIPHEVVVSLKAAAARNGRTVSAVVTDLVRRWVRRQGG